MTSFTNHYAILGLTSSATDEEIRNAWKKRARAFHPDKKKVSESEKQRYGVLFSKIREAYAVLSDKEKKIKYDTQARLQGIFLSESFSSVNINKKRNTTNLHTQKKTKSKKRRTKKMKDFYNIIGVEPKEKSNVYDGKAPTMEVTLTVGVLCNIKGGILKYVCKTFHHKQMRNSLPEGCVKELNQVTNIIIQDDTDIGDTKKIEHQFTCNKSTVLVCVEEHHIMLEPLAVYPIKRLLKYAGNTMTTEGTKYKQRGDIQLIIHFSANLIFNNELCVSLPHGTIKENFYSSKGLFTFYDKTEALKDVPNWKMFESESWERFQTATSLMVKKGEEEEEEEERLMLDYYTFKCEKLPVLATNIFIKARHLNSREGIFASLTLLDGNVIIFNFTQSELRFLLDSKTKILECGPAVSHKIIFGQGYAYGKGESKDDDAVYDFATILKRSPLVLIFQIKS